MGKLPGKDQVIECYDCQQFTGKEKSGEGLKIANHGFGRCKLERQTGVYVSGCYKRKCANFELGVNGDSIRAFVAEKQKEMFSFLHKNGKR